MSIANSDNETTVAGDAPATARAERFSSYAERYAGLGWALVPANGKRPTPRGWEQATPREPGFEAGAWAHYGGKGRNMALVCGSSGVAVVDVDGSKGEATLTRVLGSTALPPTPIVRTGRGRHLYFVDPGGLRPRVGDGLDLRAGAAAAILPPSVHPETGEEYAWEVEPWRSALAPMPEPLCRHFASTSRNGSAPKVDEVIPSGRRNAELASLAGTLRRRGLGEAEILGSLRAVNEQRCRPRLADHELQAIAVSVGRYEPDERLGKPAYTGPSRELAEVVATFRKWLHLPDPGALYVTLAAVVANRLDGDPVWLFLVGASGAGKTELLASLGGLEEIVPAAVLTEASLLSGTSRREIAAEAKGGLLRQVGEYGILVSKDFGSVLSMNRDARAAVLAALREIFDGSWTRHVGTDGGRTLHWEGKLGLVAGCTPAVDRHHAAIAALGERFAFYRLDVDERSEQGRRALSHLRRERGMRSELRDAVSGFFAGLELPVDTPTLDDADADRLVSLADLVTRSRSEVARDAYASREIELVPPAEAPGRLVRVLASLRDGLHVVGVGDDEAWRLVVKVGLDSMPAQRRDVFLHLLDVGRDTTKGTGTTLGLPTTTARRTLEDLAAHGVVVRQPGGEGQPDFWRVAEWARASYVAAAVPEMSEDRDSLSPHTAFDDISGTPSLDLDLRASETEPA